MDEILRTKLAHLNFSSIFFSDFDYLVWQTVRVCVVHIVTPVGCRRSALKVVKLEPGVIGKQYCTTRAPPPSISWTFLQASRRSLAMTPSNAVHVIDNPDVESPPFPPRSGSRSKRRSTSRKSSGCDPEAGVGGSGAGVAKGAVVAASATPDCGGSAIGGNASTGCDG